MATPRSAIPSPVSTSFLSHPHSSTSSSFPPNGNSASGSNNQNHGPHTHNPHANAKAEADLLDFLSFANLDEGMASPANMNFDFAAGGGSSGNGGANDNGGGMFGMASGSASASDAQAQSFDLNSPFSFAPFPNPSHHSQSQAQSQPQPLPQSQLQGQQYQQQPQGTGQGQPAMDAMEGEAGPSNLSVYSNHSNHSVRSGVSGSVSSIDDGTGSRRNSFAQEDESVRSNQAGSAGNATAGASSTSGNTGTRGVARGRGKLKISTAGGAAGSGRRSGSAHSSGQFTVPPTPSRATTGQSLTPKAASGMDLDQPQLSQQQQQQQQQQHYSNSNSAQPSPHGYQAGSAPNISQILQGVEQSGNSSLLNGLTGLEGMEGIEGLLGLPGFEMPNGNGNGNGGEYDAVQAGLLQQQLEQIHMQSPMIFNNNPNSNPTTWQMAQMYLTSPPSQPGNPAPIQLPENPMAQQQQQQQSQQQQQDNQKSEGEKRRYTVHNAGGLVTPGPSGEMFPQMRPEMMSPIQLEMLARSHGIEGDFNNIIPLLSPALSSHAGQSAFASPANTAAFSSGSLPVQLTPQSFSHSVASSPLEALQIQQRHFQEQLLLLQHQQRQLQATAAAVAVASSNNTNPTSASTSPYVGGTASGQTSASGHSRPANTPGVPNGTSISTPSPHYFSPLTSPALEATRQYQQQQGQQHQQQQQSHFSPAYSAHQRRTPHPLSALSSPALNPVGSSGGAQQTLSPALGPQITSGDMADPDYLRALTGMMDQTQQQNQGVAQAGNDGSSGFQQPMFNPQTGTLSSPQVNASTSTGPHRASLPIKSRPSPMMKPTNHRSHHIHPHGHSRHGSLSNSASPTILTSGRFQNQIPLPGSGTGYLPPSVIDHRGVQAHHQSLMTNSSSGLHGDAHSTPSPVDLTSMMPPPPLPKNNSKGVTPMTPASLMNLGTGSGNDANAAYNNSLEGSAVVPKRQAAVKAAQITKAAAKKGSGAAGVAGLSGNAGSASGSGGASGQNANAAGKKVKIAPVGKRALAARPAGVGVRAATKGAAAAAALIPPEGENRRTSHKAAEQKRRDSLKAGFDELRLLLPAINTEALDPESGEPIPGSSAPRLLPKSSLVPDDNPNRGVSKVALLKFSNEYIARLHEKVDKRDEYIERLRAEIGRLRMGGGDGEEVRGEDGEDLLEMDMAEGEEDYNAPPGGEDEEGEEEEDGGEEGDEGEEGEEGVAGAEGDAMEVELGDDPEHEHEIDQGEGEDSKHGIMSAAGKGRPRRTKSISHNQTYGAGAAVGLGMGMGTVMGIGGGGGAGGVKKSPALNAVNKRPGMIRGVSGGSAVRSRG